MTCRRTSAPRCVFIPNAFIVPNLRDLGAPLIEISAQTAPYITVFASHFPFLVPLIPSQHQPAFPYFLHSPRVRRKHQRLPSSLVIENPRQHTFGFHLHMTRRAFPMNANGYTHTHNSIPQVVAEPLAWNVSHVETVLISFEDPVDFVDMAFFDYCSV